MALFRQRQRKTLTSVVLGCWLFAFFVGVIHACGWDGQIGQPHQLVAAAAGMQSSADDEAPPSCKQFCADNLPVMAKLKSVQDQPGGQALLLPPLFGEPFLAGAAPVASLLHRPHPPPGIALNIRFVRLAL